MTLSLTSPYFIRLQGTEVNLFNRLVQDCEADIIRCYLPTYLPTIVATYLLLPKYLTTYRNSYLPAYLNTFLPAYLPSHPHAYLYLSLFFYLCIFRLLNSVKQIRKAASFGSCVVENGNYKNSNILFLYLQYGCKRTTTASCEIENSVFGGELGL